MSSNKTAALLLAALLAPRAAGAATAQTAAAFLQKPLGAEQASLGGAGTALYGRVSAEQYNPAANAFLAAPEASTALLLAPSGGQYGLLAYGHPTPLGTLTGSVVYFNAGSINLNLSSGERRTVTAEEDVAAGVSYAIAPLKELAIGGGARWVRLSLAETASASAALADFGALWRGYGALGGLSAGVAYQHLGKDIRFEQTGDPPPRTIRYGLAYRTGVFPARRLDPGADADVDATLLADAVKVLHEETAYRTGLELGLHPELMDRVALRLGWVFNRPGESFSFGVGVRRGRLLIDYALGSGDLGMGHQVSLSARF